MLKNENLSLQNNFLGRFTRLLQKKLKLKEVNRKLFDISKKMNVDTLEVWPGYATAFQKNGSKNLITIDTVHKICTNKIVLDLMQDIRHKSNNDYESRINEAIVGTSVMTKYNRCIYRIDKVDFSSSPMAEFIVNNKEKSKKKFVDYYKEKYDVDITVKQQPMLVHIEKRTGKEIYLVPELCVTTGLSDDQRANRQLMGALDRIIKPPPGARLNKCKELIETLKKNEVCKTFLDDWDASIKSNPIFVEGGHIDPGNLLMGDKKKLNIQNCGSLDRAVQTKMFNQKDLKTIIVFYPRILSREFNQFAGLFETCLKDFRIKYKHLKGVEIGDFRSFDSLYQACKDNLDKGVSACVWLLTGRKNNGRHYDDLKRLLVNSMPVPSQMILGSTISKGKNLRSIINKLIIQMKAKLGGVPWAIDNLPFTNVPTMVIGIDIFGRLANGKKCVVSLVSTVDRYLSKYYSQSLFINNHEELVKSIETMLGIALKSFNTSTKCYPNNIIVLREGISQGQRKKTRETEVEAFLNVLKKFREEEEKIKKDQLNLIYVTISKSNGSKFFSKNSRDRYGLGNPTQGSYIFKNICKDKNEFFLISQKPGRGLSSPTNYYILYNDLLDKKMYAADEIRDMVASLAYKLCYLYYNTVGSIKIPAPIHYAHKLATFIGEKSLRNKPINPHQHLAKIKSLYFI